MYNLTNTSIQLYLSYSNRMLTKNSQYNKPCIKIKEGDALKTVIHYVIIGLIIGWFTYIFYDLYTKSHQNIFLGLGQLTFLIVLSLIIIDKKINLYA